MQKNRSRSMLAGLGLLAFPMAASADPVDIRAVRQVLETAGVVNIEAGILYGQPMLSGELQRLGFVTGLSRCRTDDFQVPMCEEVAFKACLPLAATNQREDLLEIVNAYNLRRYSGYMVIDSDEIAGDIACTVLQFHVGDENSFGLDETFIWSQALTDFRSFLAESNVKLRDPSALY